MSADLERDLREMLQRTADDVAWTPVPTRGLVRRARRRRATVASMALIVLLAVAGTVPLAQRWIDATRVDFAPVNPGPDTPPVTPPEALGPRAPALAFGVDGGIYVAGRNGANAVRIADGVPFESADECGKGGQRKTYIAFGSAWSPDGRYLAYWDWRSCPVPPSEDGWGSVVISDPQGNVVTSFPGQGWLISWHPDSTRVAVFDTLWDDETTIPDEPTTIGVYGLDGERQAALVVPDSLVPSGDISPVWSRDGSSVLLPGVQVPLDGSEPRKIPAENFGGVYSPDGSRVAYTESNNASVESVVVTDADGSDAEKVYGRTEFPDAAWSPSGDRVAYIRVTDSAETDAEGFNLVLSSELRVRDVATGAETSLLRANAAQRLAVIEFSPDGERILYSRGTESDGYGVGSLWSINTDGSEPRRLIPRIEWADWRPPSPTG